MHQPCLGQRLQCWLQRVAAVPETSIRSSRRQPQPCPTGCYKRAESLGSTSRWISDPCRRRPAAAAAAGRAYREGGGSSDARWINKHISTARSVHELLQLYQGHKQGLDNIHIATLFVRLVSLSICQPGIRGSNMGAPANSSSSMGGGSSGSGSSWHDAEASEQLLAALLGELPRRVQHLQARQISNILWALAKMSAPPKPALLAALLQQGLDVGLSSFKTQELCNVVYSLALLRPLYHTQAGVSTLAQQSTAARQVSQQQWQRPGQQQQQQRKGQRQQSEDAVLFEQQHAQTTQEQLLVQWASVHQQQQQQQGLSMAWQPLFLDALCITLEEQLPACNAQDLSQALYSLALLQQPLPSGWLASWLRAAERQLPAFTPQGLANSAYALAKLLGEAGAPGEKSSNSGSRSGSSSRSRARQDGDPSGSSSSMGGTQPSRREEQGALVAAGQAWLEQCLRFSSLHLPQLSHRELLSQLLWAAGQLRVTPPASCLPAFLSRLEQLLPGASDQQLAALLAAAARLPQLRSLLRQQQRQQQCRQQQQQWDQEQPPPQQQQQAPATGLLGACWRSLLGLLQLGPGSCRPSCLAVLLGALADLQLHPPRQLARQLAAAAWEAALQEEQQVKVAVGLMHGCGQLGWKPPARWLLRFEGAAGRLLPAFTCQDFSNTLWALAVLEVVPSDRWLCRFLSESLPQLDRFSPQELSNTAWALGRLVHRPSSPWMQQLLSSSSQLLHRCRPADLVQLAWALAQLCYQPDPGWLARFYAASFDRLFDFRAWELTQLTRALVKLHVAVEAAWLEQLAAAVVGKLREFDARGLMVSLQGLGQLAARRQQQGAVVPGWGLLLLQEEETVVRMTAVRRPQRLEQQQQQQAMLGNGSWRAELPWLQQQQQGELHWLMQPWLLDDQGAAQAAVGEWGDAQSWQSPSSGWQGMQAGRGPRSPDLLVQPVHGRFALGWYKQPPAGDSWEGDGHWRLQEEEQQQGSIQGGASKLHGGTLRTSCVPGLQAENPALLQQRSSYQQHPYSSSSALERGELGAAAVAVARGQVGCRGLLELVMTEVYGIACLTLLMPPQMSSCFRSWPALAAGASRGAAPRSHVLGELQEERVTGAGAGPLGQ